MNEERKKILNMLSEGKISVNDAEKLMAAIEADTSSATTSDSLRRIRNRSSQYIYL